MTGLGSIPRDPVPPHLWGRDHLSVLLYLETVVVKGGDPDRDRMRTNVKRHPALAGPSLQALPPEYRTREYPTRLVSGPDLFDHDDWDCARDLEAAGLLRWEGTGVTPIFKLTDLGWKVAGKLRRHRADDGTWESFEHPVLTAISPEGDHPVLTATEESES